MFRSFFKLILFVFSLTALVLVVSLVAAPYFVRQDQVKLFIEKNVTLSDDKKIQLPKKIEFGLFPYMHFETEEVNILNGKHVEEKFENVKFGFDFNDILGKSIDFDVKVTHNKISYDANIDVIDYRNFYNNGSTPIVVKAKLPVPFTLKGNLKIDGKKRHFKDFVLSHKKTTLKGTINHESKGVKSQKIDGNIALDTDNIDDLRRLAMFDQYKSKFNMLEGTGKVVLAFSTSGYDEYTYKKNLDSEGSLKFNNIVVYGFDLDEIARNPAEVKFVEDYSRKIEVENASGLFAINKGVAELKDVIAKSAVIDLSAKGFADVAEESLNIEVNADLNTATQKLNAPLDIKGSFESPKISVRYGEAIVNNLPAILGAGGGNLEKDLKKEIKKISPKDIGKSLLGNEKAVDDIKKELKNLKGIFKGL